MATALATAPNAAPSPMAGEDHTTFVVRAHRELMAAIPDPMRRNQVVWEAWDAANGIVEQSRADEFFAADRYDKRPNVCYFAEHESQSAGPDGQPVVRRYDASKLGEIINENNFRIADVDSYTTIIDRHTAPSGQRDPSPPRTLGAAGPFRLGMIGRVNPRFAIFADEYTRKDLAGEVAARPGRSVEVLTLRANGRTYINPIAAISEAPRLPLPVQFSAAGGDGVSLDRYSSGEVVERYMSPAVPASPGGGNTYVQKFDSMSPGSPEDSTQPQESGAMLNDQDVRQIVEAIMSTEQMQWVSQQMHQAGTPAGGAPPDADPMAGQPPGQPPSPPMPPAGPAAAPTPEQQPQKFMGMQPPTPGMMRYQADDDADHYATDEDDEMNSQDWAEAKEQFAAELATEREKYAANLAQALDELADAKGRIANLEVERADANRSARLRELASRMPIDIDRELDRCLYSAGSHMDDESFDSHCEVIEQYAAKSIERVQMIPTGEHKQHYMTGDEKSQYAAQHSQVVKRLACEYANKNEVKTLEELRAEATERLKPAARAA